MQKGQLGHGDTIQRDRPTVVSELSKWVDDFFLPSFGYNDSLFGVVCGYKLKLMLGFLLHVVIILTLGLLMDV